MVVVPKISTNATTEIAKVSFTVLPLGRIQDGNGRIRWEMQNVGKAYVRLGLTCLFRRFSGA
ncbi:hypothetical protein bAD24_I08305 [Burkholderia sp. AD24]|nr:hypothetical protein bAD24_I08305 [Burkholderia sp. AD24]